VSQPTTTSSTLAFPRVGRAREEVWAASRDESHSLVLHPAGELVSRDVVETQDELSGAKSPATQVATAILIKMWKSGPPPGCGRLQTLQAMEPWTRRRSLTASGTPLSEEPGCQLMFDAIETAGDRYGHLSWIARQLDIGPKTL
jgi:hypothetical protein